MPSRDQQRRPPQGAARRLHRGSRLLDPAAPERERGAAVLAGHDPVIERFERLPDDLGVRVTC
jgi:hypothetical protein